MRIKCATIETRKWLETYIPTLDRKKLWPGVKLVVIDFKNIPKPYKFNVWCRGIKKNASDIFKLLEANDGITTKSWSVLAYELKHDGTHLTIGVGQDSFDALLNKANTLYCGLGKATFKMVKHCKENQTMLRSGSSHEDENCQQKEKH